jgi:hypothetical protein
MIRTILSVVAILLVAVGISHAAGKVAEVDAFHKVLHPLMHEAFPAKDFAKIREGLPGLIEAAETMRNARLPEELKAQQAKYRKLGDKLLKQLKAMDKGKDTMKEGKFGKKFEEMHDTFEKINDLVQ